MEPACVLLDANCIGLLGREGSCQWERLEDKRQATSCTICCFYIKGGCVSAIRTVCESELIRKEEIIEAVKLGNRRRVQPLVCKGCMREKAKS